MKENIFTHKILPILSILILVSFIFINNCFAFSVDYNENTYDLPEFPFDTSEHPIYLFGYIKSSNSFAVGYPVSAVNNNKIFCSETDALDANVYRYYIEGTTTMGEWYWYSISLNDTSSWSSVKTTSHGFLAFYSTGKLITSSVDIYESSTSDIIFFQKTPVTEQVTIPALETVEQIPEAIVKTLKVIIPVGLVVLSIFLVIYLVRRLIYRSL